MVPIEKHFDLLNYIIFFGILIICGLIGIYYSFFSKIKQNTINEYFFGGKKMSVFPISMSLVASAFTGSIIIAMPAEVYVYGGQVWAQGLAVIIGILLATYCFLPVYFDLNLNSVFEYLKLRYNSKIQKFALFLSIIRQLITTPVFIYAPSLAFSQVSGINVYTIAIITYSVCVLYTVLGGLRTVVWIDTLQAFVVFLALIFINIFGITKVGGLGTVWERNLKADRIEFFNLNFDPTLRYTLWTFMFGKSILYTCQFTVDQGMVQRHISLPTLDRARKALLISMVGLFCIMMLLLLTGIVVYSAYFDCDPVTIKKVNSAEQIVPFFIMSFDEWISGLGGLFISCLFSASLSTVSTWLNSMSCVLYTDLLKPTILRNVSEEKTSIIIKIITFLISVLCFCFIFVVERLGTLMQTVTILLSVTCSPLFGIFCLGMFLPWANSTGALIGAIVGLFVPGWISIRTYMLSRQGLIRHPTKPFSIEGCKQNWNFTIPQFNIDKTEEVFYLYRISFCYYGLMGIIATIVVGIIVSYFTGFNDPAKVDINLLSPVVRKFFKRSQQISKDVVDDVNLEEDKEELKPLNIEMQLVLENFKF